MLVSELKPDQKKIDIKVRVSLKESEGEVMIDNKEMHRIAEFLVGDGSASILLSVWDDAIENVKIGKTYRVRNGYTAMFKHSIRLNAGKYGKLEEAAEEVKTVNVKNNLSEKELGGEKA